LWAEKFDEALADLFDIEDSISERVAEALAGELTGQERRSLAARYTSDSEAYESYLRGRFYLSQRTGESLRKATECFERAVQLDAGFALAHAGIAEACVLAAIPTNLDPAPPREMVPLARAAVERALAIDERLSQAHAVLGQIAISFEWNWPAAQASFRRAIQLNPNNANAHSFYSIALGIVGDLETALQEVKLARELEPTQIVYRANVGFVLYRARRFAEAVVELRTCVALEPASAYVRYRYGLALEAVGRYEDAFSQFEAMSVLPNAQVQALVGKSYVLAVTGRAQEARGLLAQLLVIAAERYVSAYYIAEVHAGLGEIDAAMSALERAFEERAVPMISLHSNPRFDVMRAEPRFVELLRRVGLWNT
jgi:tetratricopeptide (TPR) repeat protein